MRITSNSSREAGFKKSELAVLGVVLLIVAAGVLPWWAKRETTKKCINNLKIIDGAVQQWALENKKLATDTYSLSDPALLMYLPGSVLPVCPLGGRYTNGPQVSYVPTCNIAGHTL